MGAASKTSVITPEELIITEDKKDPGMVTHSCNSNTFQVDHTPTESHTPGILRQHKLALVVGSQGRIQSWLRREKGCGSGRVGGGRMVPWSTWLSELKCSSVEFKIPEICFTAAYLS